MMFFIDPLPWVGCRSKYQLRKDFNQNQNFFLEKPIKYWHRPKGGKEKTICHMSLFTSDVTYWSWSYMSAILNLWEQKTLSKMLFWFNPRFFFQKVDKQCHNNKCDNKSLDTIFKTPRLCRYIDVDCWVDLCVV